MCKKSTNTNWGFGHPLVMIHLSARRSPFSSLPSSWSQQLPVQAYVAQAECASNAPCFSCPPPRDQDRSLTDQNDQSG